MSASLLFERARAAMEDLARQRLQSMVDSTVDTSEGRAENIAMTFVQQKAIIEGIHMAGRILIAEHKKLTEPDEAQKAPDPERKGPLY